MPTMTGIFAKTEAIAKFALLILGLLPTAAVLTGIIDIPPSLKQLLALIMGIIGLGTVVILLFVNDNMKQWSAPKAASILGLCLVVGCATSALYYEFANEHVTTYFSEPIILPLTYPAELTEIVDKGYNGDIGSALHSSENGLHVYQLIERNNGSATFLAVLLLAVSQFLVVFGLFGALMRAAVALGDEKPAEAPPATPTPSLPAEPV